LPQFEGIFYVADFDGMLVSCVGSAGGRSSAGDDEDEAVEESTEDGADDESDSAETEKE
jgi:hypothetical protein